MSRSRKVQGTANDSGASQVQGTRALGYGELGDIERQIRFDTSPTWSENHCGSRLRIVIEL
jgi:hypothetical protein